VARSTGWADLTRIKVMPVALAPPFGISVLDLPTRIPLPAKITVEVLPAIDLEHRFEKKAPPRRSLAGTVGGLRTPGGMG
jgi:hypothetical protein